MNQSRLRSAALALILAAGLLRATSMDRNFGSVDPWIFAPFPIQAGHWLYNEFNTDPQSPDYAPIPVGPFNIRPFELASSMETPGGPGNVIMRSNDLGKQIDNTEGIFDPSNWLAHMSTPPSLVNLYSHPLYLGGANRGEDPVEQVDYGLSVGPWNWNLGSYERTMHSLAPDYANHPDYYPWEPPPGAPPVSGDNFAPYQHIAQDEAPISNYESRTPTQEGSMRGFGGYSDAEVAQGLPSQV